MGQKVREQIDKNEVKQTLTGHVEIDEAYVGGKRPVKRGRGAAGKTIVMGLSSVATSGDGDYSEHQNDNAKSEDGRYCRAGCGCLG